MKLFQNKVSQCKISKTVHNVIKTGRESGEISVSNRHGLKSITDTRALRQHCTKSRNDPVIEVTDWAQEHFHRRPSLNTVHRQWFLCSMWIKHVYEICKSFNSFFYLHFAQCCNSFGIGVVFEGASFPVISHMPYSTLPMSITHLFLAGVEL